MNRYWSRKANPWVSYAVLMGGLLSAFILFYLSQIQKDLFVLAVPLHGAVGNVSEF